MSILDVTGINLRKFPRIRALDDDLWVALGDVVSENALLESQGGSGKNYQTRKRSGADALKHGEQGDIAIMPFGNHAP